MSPEASLDAGALTGRRASLGVFYMILRRIGLLAVLLLVISFGVFALLALAPGSTEQALLGGRPASPELVEALREQYGLDQPFMTQYWIWLQHAVQGDFGHSIRTGESVADTIASHATVTIFLAVYAFIIAIVCGIILGVVAALRKLTVVDTGIVALSVVGISSPAFATGLVLLFVFGIVLNVLPIYGLGEGFTGWLYHLTLPALTLVIAAGALVVKFTRAGMIEALAGDHIVFAQVRGIRRHRIVLQYALRNALVPVITASGLILTYMLTGTVLVEVTFALPGMGALLVDSVTFKDVPTVQGIALVVATFVIVVNLLVDLLYLVVDPRIRARARLS